MAGSGLELSDAVGNKLAKLKSSGFRGAKQLELLVQCDKFFFDLVLVSAMVAKGLTRANNEVIAEVAGGVAGA
jgi:hypothetical protein